MLKFERITEESLDKVVEIVQSNAAYNILENGNPQRTIKEIRSEFLNPATDSFLIKIENNYVGLIDFLRKNPRDGCPWLGLMMIHSTYHSMGYGKKAYRSFEERLKKHQFESVRLGVLQKNMHARVFWESLGFEFYGESEWEGRAVDCFEKRLN